MTKIFHVFISSTYRDLKDERGLVSESLARAGYVPEGMEIFPASSQKQMDFIRSVIDRCDYYLLIIGKKYGSEIEPGKSYTQAELEYALEKDIPVLSFLVSEEADLVASKIEKDDEKNRNLALFRKFVETKSLVDYWVHPSELAAKSLAALAQEVNRSPGIGWVRGDQIPASDIYREIDELRRENTMLLRQLERTNVSNQDDEQVVTSGLSIDSPFPIRYKIRSSYSSALASEQPLKKIALTPREIIVSTALSYSKSNSTRPLIDYIKGKIKPRGTTTYSSSSDITIEDSEISVVVMALSSLGLWQSNGSNYQITELGQRIFLESRIN